MKGHVDRIYQSIRTMVTDTSGKAAWHQIADRVVEDFTGAKTFCTKVVLSIKPRLVIAKSLAGPNGLALAKFFDKSMDEVREELIGLMILGIHPKTEPKQYRKLSMLYNRVLRHLAQPGAVTKQFELLNLIRNNKWAPGDELEGLDDFENGRPDDDDDDDIFDGLSPEMVQQVIEYMASQGLTIDASSEDEIEIEVFDDDLSPLERLQKNVGYDKLTGTPIEPDENARKIAEFNNLFSNTNPDDDMEPDFPKETVEEAPVKEPEIIEDASKPVEEVPEVVEEPVKEEQPKEKPPVKAKTTTKRATTTQKKSSSEREVVPENLSPATESSIEETSTKDVDNSSDSDDTNEPLSEEKVVINGRYIEHRPGQPINRVIERTYVPDDDEDDDDDDDEDESPEYTARQQEIDDLLDEKYESPSKLREYLGEHLERDAQAFMNPLRDQNADDDYVPFTGDEIHEYNWRCERRRLLDREDKFRKSALSEEFYNETFRTRLPYWLRDTFKREYIRWCMVQERALLPDDDEWAIKLGELLEEDTFGASQFDYRYTPGRPDFPKELFNYLSLREIEANGQIVLDQDKESDDEPKPTETDTVKESNEPIYDENGCVEVDSPEEVMKRSNRYMSSEAIAKILAENDDDDEDEDDDESTEDSKGYFQSRLDEDDDDDDDEDEDWVDPSLTMVRELPKIVIHSHDDEGNLMCKKDWYWIDVNGAKRLDFPSDLNRYGEFIEIFDVEGDGKYIFEDDYKDFLRDEYYDFMSRVVSGLSQEEYDKKVMDEYNKDCEIRDKQEAFVATEIAKIEDINTEAETIQNDMLAELKTMKTGNYDPIRGLSIRGKDTKMMCVEYQYLKQLEEEDLTLDLFDFMMYGKESNGDDLQAGWMYRMVRRELYRKLMLTDQFLPTPEETELGLKNTSLFKLNGSTTHEEYYRMHHIGRFNMIVRNLDRYRYLYRKYGDEKFVHWFHMTESSSLSGVDCELLIGFDPSEADNMNIIRGEPTMFELVVQELSRRSGPTEIEDDDDELDTTPVTLQPSDYYDGIDGMMDEINARVDKFQSGIDRELEQESLQYLEYNYLKKFRKEDAEYSFDELQAMSEPDRRVVLYRRHRYSVFESMEKYDGYDFNKTYSYNKKKYTTRAIEEYFKNRYLHVSKCIKENIKYMLKLGASHVSEVLVRLAQLEGKSIELITLIDPMSISGHDIVMNRYFPDWVELFISDENMPDPTPDDDTPKDTEEKDKIPEFDPDEWLDEEGTSLQLAKMKGEAPNRHLRRGVDKVEAKVKKMQKRSTTTTKSSKKRKGKNSNYKNSDTCEGDTSHTSEIEETVVLEGDVEAEIVEHTSEANDFIAEIMEEMAEQVTIPNPDEKKPKTKLEPSPEIEGDSFFISEGDMRQIYSDVGISPEEEDDIGPDEDVDDELHAKTGRILAQLNGPGWSDARDAHDRETERRVRESEETSKRNMLIKDRGDYLKSLNSVDLADKLIDYGKLLMDPEWSIEPHERGKSIVNLSHWDSAILTLILGLRGIKITDSVVSIHPSFGEFLIDIHINVRITPEEGHELNLEKMTKIYNTLMQHGKEYAFMLAKTITGIPVGVKVMLAQSTVKFEDDMKKYLYTEDLKPNSTSAVNRYRHTTTYASLVAMYFHYMGVDDFRVNYLNRLDGGMDIYIIYDVVKKESGEVYMGPPISEFFKVHYDNIFQILEYVPDDIYLNRMEAITLQERVKKGLLKDNRAMSEDVLTVLFKGLQSEPVPGFDDGDLGFTCEGRAMLERKSVRDKVNTAPLTYNSTLPANPNAIDPAIHYIAVRWEIMEVTDVPKFENVIAEEKMRWNPWFYSRQHFLLNSVENLTAIESGFMYNEHCEYMKQRNIGHLV